MEKPMKQYAIRVTAALLTFSIGIFAAHRLRTLLTEEDQKTAPAIEGSLPRPADLPQDHTVYSARLCDLVGSNRYDGKLVRIQATYNQGTDTASLSDPACDAWLRPTCSPSKTSCEEIWNRVLEVEDSSRYFRVVIDVIGRYTEDVEDPDPNQGPSHVHLFEILELKGAKPAPRQRR
jgi:hypothetical protein